MLLLKGIRAYLVVGLEVGERLTINGFQYTVPADKWVTRDGKTYFVNHLYTTATVESDNATDKVVSGTDYHRVNKAEYTFANLHVYDWGKLDTKQADGSFVGSSFGISVSSAEMIKIMEETLGEGALSGKNLEFKLSSPSGNLEGGDVNKNVTEISEGEFYYKRGNCGADAYYVTCFSNGVDTVDVRITLPEETADGLTKMTGVEMTRTVTFAPANVMYYEDDFVGTGAITYVSTGTDASGDSLADYMNYGPNNEIYLSASTAASSDAQALFTYIAFYVELDESYEGVRSIQVGAHLKDTDVKSDAENTAMDMLFGGKAGDFTSDVENNGHKVRGGTEQYSTVDSDLIFTNPNGTSRAPVIIGTTDASANALALTNIKLNGYKLSVGTAATEITAIQDMSDVYAGDIAFRTVGIYDAMVHTINE